MGIVIAENTATLTIDGVEWPPWAVEHLRRRKEIETAICPPRRYPYIRPEPFLVCEFTVGTLPDHLLSSAGLVCRDMGRELVRLCEECGFVQEHHLKEVRDYQRIVYAALELRFVRRAW